MLDASDEVRKANLVAKYQPLFDGCPRSTPLRDLAEVFVTLQGLRHSADYDLGFRLVRAEVEWAVDQAEGALGAIEALRGDAAVHRYLFAMQAHAGLRA